MTCCWIWCSVRPSIRDQYSAPLDRPTSPISHNSPNIPGSAPRWTRTSTAQALGLAAAPGNDDCADRDAGDNSAIIRSADPRPDTAHIGRATIRTTNRSRPRRTANCSPTVRPTAAAPPAGPRTAAAPAGPRTAAPPYGPTAAPRPQDHEPQPRRRDREPRHSPQATNRSPASRATVRGPAGWTAHRTPAERVRGCRQPQQSSETKSGQPVHCADPIDCLSAAPSCSRSAPSGGSNRNSASDGCGRETPVGELRDKVRFAGKRAIGHDQAAWQ